MMYLCVNEGEWESCVTSIMRDQWVLQGVDSPQR